MGLDPQFLVAQNLGEYASLGGAIAEGVSHLRLVIEDGISSLDRKQWAAVIGGLFLVWFLFFRRR